MIEDTKAKKFTSQYYKMGVAEGVINVEVTPAFKDKLTPDQIKAIEAARTKIASGELKVPFVPK
jgi:simple sugar transport system substrate-binding protein/basic membrane protein A